jgi:hypothetical protein
MTRITILLPSGLTAHGTHGLAVRSRGKTISYAAAIRRRVVGAVVRQPVSVITALVGSPPLSAGPQLVHRARSPHPRRLQLIVVVTQRGGGTTRVSLSLLPK